MFNEPFLPLVSSVSQYQKCWCEASSLHMMFFCFFLVVSFALYAECYMFAFAVCVYNVTLFWLSSVLSHVCF